MLTQANSRRHWRAAFLVLAEAGAAAAMSLALLMPADAQFWGQWDNRQPNQRQQQQQQQQQYNPFGGGWFGNPREPQPRREPRESREPREAPVDYSRAPSTQRKGDTTPSTPIVVMGDGMADWLAYGLEDAFSEKPEIGIVRKQRAAAGLIRYDTRRDRDVEWPQVVRESITADKPKFIVMMIGVNDRQSIRERAPTPAVAPAAAAAPGRPGAAKPAAPPPAPIDPELQAQQSADRQNAELQEAEEQPPAAAPEPARGVAAGAGNFGLFEFRSEKWEAAYSKRIDATIAAMKSAGVPVFWVGLPSQRGPRASSDAAYLNEIFRSRAEKAAITYVDVWDGFVDDAGRFTPQGPDFEGQIRRLRANDGVYFTKAGARKLAHYVEREIERSMANRVVPVALPAPEPGERTPGVRPVPGFTSRPLAGPVVPLTVSTGATSDALLGAAATRPTTTADPVATRVLTKGEPIAAPIGRADDFVWPRSTAVATQPVPEPEQPATATTRRRSGQAATASGATTTGQEAEPPQPPRQRVRTNATTGEAPPRPPLSITPSASAPRGPVH